MARIITIPYKPRNWAKILHDSVNRWIIMVLHRRAGKTTAVLNHLQRDALKVPKSLYAYIAPTYKQAKRIAWDIAKTISRPIPGVEPNEAELTIKYPNGSKLMLLGSENVDALRGMGLWGGGQDEAPQHPPNLFSEIISKCLADHLGYWIFFGTPKGKGYFYDIYKKALGDENWTTIYKTIDDSLKEESGETIDNLKQALEDDRRLVQQDLMTKDEFNQEWYCSFEAAIKGAYYSEQLAEMRQAGRIKVVPYDKELKVHTVWDLGVGQALGIGFYQKCMNEAQMIDYWEGEGNEGIYEAIKVLQDKKYIYGKHFAPHDIRAKEISTGQTRLDFAKKHGIKFEIIPNLWVDDGINRGKLLFAHLWVDAQKCEKWLDIISQYKREYDDDKKMFVEKPYHDFTSHAADVHRYAAIVENKMTNEEIYYPQPDKPNPAI